MTHDKNIQAEKIHIVSIRTLKESFDIGEDLNPEDIVSHKIEHELKTGMDVAQKAIGLKHHVDIVALNRDNTELPAKASFTHEIVFEVENLDAFVEVQDDIHKLKASLGSVVVGITISTVRGIIFARTQGTQLGAVVIPVVSPIAAMGLKK